MSFTQTYPGVWELDVTHRKDRRAFDRDQDKHVLIAECRGRGRGDSRLDFRFEKRVSVLDLVNNHETAKRKRDRRLPYDAWATYRTPEALSFDTYAMLTTGGDTRATLSIVIDALTTGWTGSVADSAVWSLFWMLVWRTPDGSAWVRRHAPKYAAVLKSVPFVESEGHHE